jgi:hypothetical protein
MCATSARTRTRIIEVEGSDEDIETASAWLSTDVEKVLTNFGLLD